MSTVPGPCSLFRDSGMTLVELMVAVAVIGLLSTMAFPVCQPLILKYRMNATARQLAANLLWARLKAISQQNNFIIQFDAPDAAGTYKYRIFSDDNYNGARDLDEEYREFSLTAGIQFTSSQEITSPLGEDIQEADGVTFSGNRLIFAPRGTANESGSIYLVPTDDVYPSVHYDRSKALTVSNTTGRVRVWKYCPQNTPGPWE